MGASFLQVARRGNGRSPAEASPTAAGAPASLPPLTAAVLEPVAFLARIASIIPPPRFPLLRLAGVLAPHSSWRSAVVPKAPAPRSCAAPSTTAKTKTKKPKDAPGDPCAILAGKGASSSGAGRACAQTPSNAQRTSLGAGIAKPVGARIDWATLIRHIYLDDVLACPCGGCRRVLAHIDQPVVVAAILELLGLPAEPPPIARARSPAFDPA